MSSKTTTKTHQVQGPEQWVQDEGAAIYNKTKSEIPTKYKAYKGTRVADYGDDYYKAQEMIRGIDPNGSPELDKSGQVLDQLFGMDSSYLNQSMDQRMNPYTDAVLDPTLRNLNEQRQFQLNEDNANATMAGAFGDPQAGLVRTASNSKFNEAVTDASNRAYSQAWDAAQNQTNVAAARLSNTGQQYANLDQGKFNRKTNLAKFLTQFGLADQQYDQAKADVKYSDHLMKNGGYAQQRASYLMDLLNKTPHDTISDGTQTQEQSGMGQLFQMLGKLGGAALGGTMGGPTGASMGASLFGGGGGAAAPAAPPMPMQTGQFEWPTSGAYSSFNPVGYYSV